MILNDGRYHECDAGRRSTYMGRWKIPCLRAGTNALAFGAVIGANRAPGTPILHFCHEHMAELIEGGIVDEVAVEPDEWDRRTR